MSQTLSESDHEEIVGILLMILGQLSEHGGESGVIRSRANDSHREDGVVSYFGIAGNVVEVWSMNDY